MTPTSFVLTLDTAAPEITWELPLTVTVGELLEVGYELSEEGEIIAAALVLADASEVALVPGPDTLSATVPESTALGPAYVRVVLRDAVWNAATYRSETLVVVRLLGPAVAGSAADAPQGRANRGPSGRADGGGRGNSDGGSRGLAAAGARG
jgi:hypothetical protein